MKRQKKKWDPPSRPFSEERLRNETRLIGTYGLRNKKELWKARTKISKLRHRARELLGQAEEEFEEEKEEAFIGKLYKLGVLSEDDDLESVLRLEARDLLERRLQTQVYREGLAKSIWHARQMVVHGHIVVEANGDEKVVTSPSYQVRRKEKVKIHPNSSLKETGEEE